VDLLTKVDRTLILLGRAENLVDSIKQRAAKSEDASLAIKATNAFSAVSELKEAIEERRTMYVDRQVELGKMRRIPVENLDKPKLTLIRKGVK
jgi:hypothetical protein